MASLLFFNLGLIAKHKQSAAMGTSEKSSIWYSFSSERRKERKANTTTKPSHNSSWLRGQGNSSNASKPPTAQQSELPPPYTEREIPSIKISTPEDQDLESDSQYSFLRDFDTIFLVDDSSSMQGNLWKEAEEAIAAIAPICTKYDSDGIDIYFLNHRPRLRSNHNSNNRPARSQSMPKGYHNITTAQQVNEIFAAVQPRGGTQVGHRLHDILDPYMRRVQAMQQAKVSGRISKADFVKPINIITITDGVFTDDAEGVIIKTAKMLDGPCDAIPWQVGIQFFQIGDDEGARRELEGLDDYLGERCRDSNMRDIVDTVSWKNRDGDRLVGDGILKIVLGAVNKRLDRRRV
ncbi:hypothetical protein N7475_009932 [Penicillium sp. IBT 31633x]|nr:hypothetical protein N7475_009932 [Penicillium sp. IBT 31633x]